MYCQIFAIIKKKIHIANIVNESIFLFGDGPFAFLVQLLRVSAGAVYKDS